MTQDINDALRAGTFDPSHLDDITPTHGNPTAAPKSIHDIAPSIGTFLDTAADQLTARALGNDPAIEMPWPSIASTLGGPRFPGLRPGLYVLVGNTGSGKSQFALQLGHHAATRGTPTLYVGLELRELDLVSRLTAIEFPLSLHRPAPHWSSLYLGSDPFFAAKDPQRVDERRRVREALSVLPIHCDFSGPHKWNPYELYDTVTAMRAKGEYPHITDATGTITGRRPILVILDYLQVIGDPTADMEKRRRMELRERIGTCAAEAAAVARDLDAAVVLLSSTRREKYAMFNGENDQERPGNGSPLRFLDSGKDSGEIEYAADAVLALCTMPRVLNESSRRAYVAVAKVRAGGSEGWAGPFNFDGNTFTEEPSFAPRLPENATHTPRRVVPL